MNKMNVMVVFGGVSSEHPISCISAASILRNIDKEKYTIYPVGITRDGAWRLIESEDFDSIEHRTTKRFRRFCLRTERPTVSSSCVKPARRSFM